MKRTISLAAALLACLALGSIAVASAQSERRADVKAKVTLKYAAPEPGDPYGRSEFKGVVKAKKGCDAKRNVKVKGAGKTTTSKSGKYEITLNSEPAPGVFQAKVKAATIEKGDKEIDCAAAKSKQITVP